MVVRGKGKRRKRPLDGGSYPKVLAKLYPDLQTLREAVGLVASFEDDSGELDGARGSHHSSRDGDAASPSFSLSRTPRNSHQDLANLLDETYVVEISNSALKHRRAEPDPDADATVRLTRGFWLKLVTGEAGASDLLLSDEFEIEGSRMAFLSVLAGLDAGDGNFAIVTP